MFLEGSPMFFNANRVVQPEPGIIVGPIANFLGFILDFIFEISTNISLQLALGLSIIIFTIVVRILLLPLAIRMHKNMEKIRALKPQMDAITKKYEGVKSPETTRQKNIEIQKLYAENGANPLGGCLPLIIQMPIFITLFTMFQRPYIYISRLGHIYEGIAEQIMLVPNYYTYIIQTNSIGFDKIPNNISLDLAYQSELMRLFNVYTSYDWDTLLSVLPSQHLNYTYISSLLYEKNIIEHFLTISLVDPTGFVFPGVILAILSAATTFLTSKLMMKQQMAMAGNNPTIVMQQKIMLYAMPILMGGFTITAPAGVGLYWVASNISHLFQHIAFTKFLNKNKSEHNVTIE